MISDSCVRSILRCLAAVVVCLVWMAAAVANQPASSQPAVLQEIIAAWEARQEQLRTLRLAWTIERTDPKGATSEFMSTLPSKSPKPAGAGPVPPTDMTYTSTDEVWFDGRRVRWETEGSRPFTPEGQQSRLVSIKQVSVFDGEYALQYQVSEHNDLTKQGYKLKGKPLPIQTALTAKPVFALVRPFDPAFGRIDKERLRVSHWEKGLSGSDQVILEFDAGHGRRRMWVDPKLTYGITRYLWEYSSGKAQHQIDVTYRLDKTYGWLPDKWRTASFAENGAPLLLHACRVNMLQLNEPMADNIFRIHFPDGTRVVDEKATPFVAGADGNLQPAMLTTPSRSPSLTTVWTVIFIVVPLAALVLFFALWRKRKAG